MSRGIFGIEVEIAPTADPSEAFVVEIVELDHELYDTRRGSDGLNLDSRKCDADFVNGLERRRPRLQRRVFQ